MHGLILELNGFCVCVCVLLQKKRQEQTYIMICSHSRRIYTIELEATIR